jgi:hypothetical protein
MDISDLKTLSVGQRIYYVTLNLYNRDFEIDIDEVIVTKVNKKSIRGREKDSADDYLFNTLELEDLHITKTGAKIGIDKLVSHSIECENNDLKKKVSHIVRESSSAAFRLDKLEQLDKGECNE